MTSPAAANVVEPVGSHAQEMQRGREMPTMKAGHLRQLRVRPQVAKSRHREYQRGVQGRRQHHPAKRAAKHREGPAHRPRALSAMAKQTHDVHHVEGARSGRKLGALRLRPRRRPRRRAGTPTGLRRQAAAPSRQNHSSRAQPHIFPRTLEHPPKGSPPPKLQALTIHEGASPLSSRSTPTVARSPSRSITQQLDR